MGGLKMPGKGQAAQLLSELNAEHAPKPEEPATEEGSETNVTTLQETLEVANDATNDRTKELPKTRTNGRSNATAKQRAKEVANERSTPAVPEQTGREERLGRALLLAAEDEVAVVTVRVSGRLNEYMDRYVERINRLQPKRKYRKQDAVAEAFAAFFADHPMPPAPAEDEL